MRVATSPINWNNEDVPDYRPWLPYPDVLDAIVDAGYTATEWSSSLADDADALLPELRARELTMLGAFVGLDLRDPARRDEALDRALLKARFLASIGGSFLVAADAGSSRRREAAGHVTSDLALREPAWRSLSGGLDLLGRRIAGLGLRLVFHNHVGTHVETAAETAELLERTDPEAVAWCLDCGHLAYGGGDVLAMLARFGDRVEYAHIKDVDGDKLRAARRERWSFDEALRGFIFCPLGEGVVPIPAVIDAVGARCPDAWLVVEQDTTDGDPTATARANRGYLAELL